MSCENYRKLMMGAVDNELTSTEIESLNRHLESCSSCFREYNSFKELGKVTEKMKILMPEDKFWDGYWEGIYRRMERSAGWLLFSIGALILILFGAFEVSREFFWNPEIPLILKLGCAVLGTGAIVLLVSALRERLYAECHQRYRDVRR